jgi:hypothetical protein
VVAWAKSSRKGGGLKRAHGQARADGNKVAGSVGHLNQQWRPRNKEELSSSWTVMRFRPRRRALVGLVRTAGASASTRSRLCSVCVARPVLTTAVLKGRWRGQTSNDSPFTQGLENACSTHVCKKVQLRQKDEQRLDGMYCRRGHDSES